MGFLVAEQAVHLWWYLHDICRLHYVLCLIYTGPSRTQTAAILTHLNSVPGNGYLEIALIKIEWPPMEQTVKFNDPMGVQWENSPGEQ